MKGDFHVRFRENAGVKFPCVTRLGDTRGQRCYRNFENENLMKKNVL